jgi:sodium transport system permease protein
MHTILTVFRKELLSTLRDRKTLMSAVFIPALAVPLLILGITKLQRSLSEKENSKKLKVALYNEPAAVRQLFADSTIELVTAPSFSAAKDSIAKESYDAVLSFAPGTEAQIESLKPAAVSFYYKSTEESVEDRITQKLEQYQKGILSQRFQRLNLSQDMLIPLTISPVDVASTKEQLGRMLGGFLPYMFLLFCFMGCMYPALDLTTGEKEKGTLETLLTTPAARLQILFGKMMVIGLMGVVGAFMTMAGMYTIIQLSREIPKEIVTAISEILSLRFVLMLFAMLVPLSLFFAGVLSAVAIRASSFKEAQSYVTPMTFVVIVPAMVALMPGVKLSWSTVWIPILNVALATKEIIAGTMNSLQFVAIVLSLILLAVLAMVASVRQFSNEKNILK